MRTPWISCSIAVATLLFSGGCGKREEVVVVSSLPATPEHGGDVVVLGDARFEVVHDPAVGIVSVYQLRGDRAVVLSDAPSVEIRSASAVVPVTLVRVDDGVWRATHASLRDAPENELVVVARIDGRRFDEPLSSGATTTPRVTPASVPPTPTPLPPERTPLPRDEPAAPGREEPAAPAADRTENMLSLDGGGTAKVTRSGSEITVSATDADGKAIEIEKAVLVVGSKETLLLKSGDLWTGTVETAEPAAGAKLVLTVAGKERTASFPSGWGSAPAEPAAPPPPAPVPPGDAPAPESPRDEDVKKIPVPGGLLADEEPVNPPDPHPEPAGKPGPANPPSAKVDSNASEARVALEGSFLLAVPGTEARLEVLHDKNAGKITVQPVRGEVAFLLDEPPVLFLASKEPAGVGKTTLNRLEGKPVWWAIHTELKDRDILGKLRLVIAGKEYDVDLAGPRVVAAPGSYVVFGTTRADVDLDRGAGLMAVRAGTQLQSLTFLARAADGRTIPIVLAPVPGHPGHFRATHDAFRVERLDGRFTARIEGRDVEGALQTGARTDATRPGAGASSTAPPAAGGGTGR